MGTKLILQPEDQFGLWSTCEDRIYLIDASEEELIDYWKKRAAFQAEREMREWIEQAKANDPRGPKMTLRSALKSHRFHRPGLLADCEKTNPEYAKVVEAEMAFDAQLRQDHGKN